MTLKKVAYLVAIDTNLKNHITVREKANEKTVRVAYLPKIQATSQPKVA